MRRGKGGNEGVGWGYGGWRIGSYEMRRGKKG